MDDEELATSPAHPKCHPDPEVSKSHSPHLRKHRHALDPQIIMGSRPLYLSLHFT